MKRITGKSKKEQKEPSRPHPSQRPNQMDFQGHVMTSEEQKAEWARRGRCQTCGLVQTKKRNFLGTKMEVLTIPGKVYKGICLQCYSLEQAKVKLGELDPSNRIASINRTASREPSTAPSGRGVEPRGISALQESTSFDETPARTRSRELSRGPGSRGFSLERSKDRGYSLERSRDRTDNVVAAQSPPRGFSRDHVDEENRGNLPADIPHDVGPRMGGLQKQISEITLDSTMMALSPPFVEKIQDKSVRMGSLDNIAEDDSSHRRGDASRGQLSTGRTDTGNSRVGAFAAEASPMERMEQRIRAKNEAANAEAEARRLRQQRLDEAHRDHHVHFPKNDGGMKPAIQQHRIFKSENLGEDQAQTSKQVNTGFSRLRKAGSGTDSTFNRSKTNDSGAESSTPGVVHMQADRANLFERRIQEKNDQFQQSPSRKPDNINERNRGSGSISERSGDSDVLPSKQTVDESFHRLATNESGEGSAPGVFHVQADRANLFERRIREKNDQFHQSLVKEPPSDERKESLQNVFRRDHVPQSPGATVTKPGIVREGRLNAFEERIRKKASGTRDAPSDASEKLPSSTSTEHHSKPGIFQENVQEEGGRINVYERRIQQKQYEAEQLHHGIVKEASATNLFNQRLNAKLEEHDSQRKYSPNPRSMSEKSHETDSSEGHPATLKPQQKGKNDVKRKAQHRNAASKYSSDSHARAELCEMKRDGNCDDITTFLRVNSNSLPPEVIVFAFECIREIMSENYERTTLFRSKVSWLKIFAKLMDIHFSNEVIHFEAMRTLWAIASFSSRHAKDIISNDESIESLIDSMEAHHQSEAVHEYGCGLIAFLAATEEYAVSLLECCDGQVVNRLMTALTSSSRTGAPQLNAVKALLRLSSAFASSGLWEGSFGDEMGRFIENPFINCPTANSIIALLNAMKQHPQQLPLQTEGSRLLCQIFWAHPSQDANLDSDGEIFYSVAQDVLCRINSILDTPSHSLALHEALVYLLSNISTYSLDMDIDTNTLSKNVLDIMRANPDSPVIALHGCRSIYSLCAGDSNQKHIRLAIASSEGIETIIKCMTIFPEHEIIGEACGALFSLCCDVPSNKKLVLKLGGIDPLCAASINGIGVDSGDDDTLSMNLRAIAALITLSIDPSCHDEIRSKGIIDNFNSVLNSVSLPESIRSKMHELVQLESESITFSFESDMSEEETSDCLLANLKTISLPNRVDNRQALILQSNTVSSMQKFSINQEIQENGCKILACIASKSNADSKGLETAVACISSENPHTVAATASLFRNFCLTQPTSQLDSYESQCLSNILLRSASEFMKAIRLHKSDESVIEHVLSALWAIASAEKEVVLSFESEDFISLLLEYAEKFRSSKVKEACLGLLYTLFSVSERTNEFLTENLILDLVGFIKSDEESVAKVASSMIWVISEKGAFLARMKMLDHHEALIGAVVECMFKFPRNPLMIRASCDILSNLALDNYYRCAICDSGGTGRVNEALGEFADDELTTCKALMSLTNLISGADVEVLRLTEVAKNILESMSAHREALYVQVHGASAIWHLASRDDLFKDVLVEAGAVKCISEAMTLFVASEKMTRKGLVALWSLSVPVHLKAQVGIDCLAPVVNGISAHISSEQVCEEGLGALKSLSTVNKDLLEENDVLDLIFSCMWLHSHNPNIQQASFAALVNISVDMQKKQVCRITCEDLDTIVNMMRIHQSVKAVQETAIMLLRNFTFSPHNVRILQENIFLAGLVRVAMATFHDTFGGRAEDLLRVLPPDHQ